MIDSSLPTLQHILTGIWDSPIMTLQFYEDEAQQARSGKVTSASNGTSIEFNYNLLDEAGRVTLRLTTAMTGSMDYIISDWSSGHLTLMKPGSGTPTAFHRRAE